MSEVSNEDLALPMVNNPTSALGHTVGAVHYWHKRYQLESKGRIRRIVVAFVLGAIVSQLGSAIAGWASSAF
jgi:hypothetical protein